MTTEPQRPHDELGRFLSEVRTELEWALREHPEWFGRRYPEFMRAWRELDNEVFPSAMGWLGEVSESDLAREGLTGDQLRLKLTLVADARDELEDARRGKITSPPAGGVFRRIGRWVASRRGGVMHAFGAFLEIADVVLESLGKAIPGPGAIAEFKDAVKSMLGAS